MKDTGERLRIALMLESDGPGGAENVLLHLARALRGRGHDVLPVGPANGCGWLAGRFRKLGFHPATFSLSRPLDWRCLRGLLTLLGEHRTDVVHSHEFTMAVYGAAAARIRGIRHVVTMHGGRNFAARRRRRIALRWAFRNSHRVVAVSAATRAYLASSLAWPADSIALVPNGIEFKRGVGEHIRRELNCRPGQLLILSVGNLYPVKGHIVLLRALVQVRSSAPNLDWQLAIAGRGGEAANLKAFADENGIGQRVHLLGFRDDVCDLLEAADVFALPSLCEGLPVALLEAMFAGKPVVASAVGGIPDAIEPGRHGLLIPAADHAALATAFLQTLSDARLRTTLGTAAARAARAHFSLDAMATAYEMLYRET